MFRKVLLFLVAVLFFSLTGGFLLLAWAYEDNPAKPNMFSLPIPHSSLSRGKIAAINQIVIDYQQQHKLPSLSLAVGRAGELSLASTAGYSDLAQLIPATPESLYRIGSVSKSITAVVMGRLMMDNVVDVNQPVTDFLDELPAWEWPFTLRQLASHTAGIRHYRQGPIATWNENFHDVHYDTVAEPISLVAHDPLLFEPGSAFQYSSYGFNILSAALSAADQKPFRAQLRDYVFQPAGMTTAHAEDSPQPAANTVGFYLYFDGYSFRAPYSDNSYKLASGGIMATPSELVLFGNALLQGKLVDHATREALFTPVALNDGSTTPQNYSLGFGVEERTINGKTYREVGHGGTSVGGQTAFLMFPDQDLVIAVTTNVLTLSAGVSPYTPALAVAALLLDEGMQN